METMTYMETIYDMIYDMKRYMETKIQQL